MTLQTIVDSDDRWSCRSVLAREANDLIFGHSAYLGRARRRKLSNTLAEFVEPERMMLDVVAVFQFVADDHVHDRESQRRIGARPHLYELMTLIDRVIAIRIYADELRAVCNRLFYLRPEVNIRRKCVRSPKYDQPRAMEVLHVGADSRANGVTHCVATGSRADRARQLACAEPIKEAPIHAAAVDNAHRAAVAVRQNRFGTVTRLGDLSKAASDCGQSLVPTYALEAAFALGADSPHRIEHAIRVVDAFQIACDFCAEKALSRRMIGIARDSRCASIFDFDRSHPRSGTFQYTPHPLCCKMPMDLGGSP